MCALRWQLNCRPSGWCYAVLEEMEDLDPERDPQARIAIENTILDYARTALMASAAAETTLMQRQLARELSQ